jgi:hypothetical protein
VEIRFSVVMAPPAIPLPGGRIELPVNDTVLYPPGERGVNTIKKWVL